MMSDISLEVLGMVQFGFAGRIGRMDRWVVVGGKLGDGF